MKLIYISSYNIPTKNALGIQITQMCNAFADSGAEVELIVPKQKNKDIFEYYGLPENFKVKHIFRLELTRFGKLGFLVQTFLYLIFVKFYLTSRKYDFLYTREQFAGLFFKNFVYEAHNFPKKITFLHRLSFKNIKKIIAITSFLKKEFIKNGFDENRIMIAPDAVNLKKFNIDISQEEAREKLDLPKNKKIIGYVGKYATFDKGNKGVDNLINIFPEILKDKPESFLLIVGVGEENVNKIHSLLKNLGVGNSNYRIIGHLPYDEVIYSLRASDILVMNYSKYQYHTYYTSPMKMFEYMASKRPIIASDLPAMREILNENNAMFIKPDDTESLKNGIKKLLENTIFADKISEQAYIDVQKYTWNNRAKNIINFIK